MKNILEHWQISLQMTTNEITRIPMYVIFNKIEESVSSHNVNNRTFTPAIDKAGYESLKSYTFLADDLGEQ